MDEAVSKGAELQLQASLRESAGIFNRWVISNPTPLPLRAIDERLVLRIAALPIERCERILSNILASFARFSFLRDIAKIVEPGPAAKHAIFEANKSVVGLGPIYHLISCRLAYELRNNKAAWDVLIVRESDVLNKFPETMQLVSKAFKDLSNYSVNTYENYLKKNQLSGEKIYPDQYPEKIWSLLGEAVMKCFPSQTAQDRRLADKVRDLFRAVKGDEEAKALNHVPNAVALDLIDELRRKHPQELPLDSPIREDSELTLEDILSDDFERDELEKILDTQKIISAISNPGVLTDRERQVLGMRCALQQDKEMTQEEIGKALNISQPRVRAIEKSAVGKLQRLFKKRS